MKTARILPGFLLLSLLVSITAARPIPMRPPGQGGPSEDSGLPERLDINLDRSLMWNPLPPEITSATQGPDGRVWLTVTRPLSGLSRDSIETVLRQEFSEKMPQLSAVRPILFEPTGRVWFATDPLTDDQGRFSSGILLGFDGNTFIDRAINAVDRPTSFGTQRSPSTAFADGHAFFSTLDTIYIYDGKQWSSREVPSGKSYGEAPYKLFVEPDGKGVIGVPHDSSNALIRWRAGEWTKFTLPFGDESASRYSGRENTIIGAAPRADGIWLQTSEGLYFLRYETAATQSQPLTVSKLIEQLKDPNFDNRELATQRLIAKGFSIEPEIRKALDTNRKDESRYRLEYILANLRRTSYVPEPTRYSQFGNYRLQSINLLLPLPNGGTLVAAKYVTTDSPPANVPPSVDRSLSKESTLFLQEPNGNIRMLQGADLSYNIHFSSIESQVGQMLAITDNLIWLKGDGFHCRPALVDLNAGKSLRSLPLWNIDSLNAITADGAVFFRSRGRFYAYHPDGKDPRIPLQPSNADRAYFNGLLTGDGAYWYIQSPTQPRSNPLVRFDGKNTQVCGAATVTTLTSNVTPGHDGLLLSTGKSWTLVSPRGTHFDELLEDLIAKNSAEFAMTFVGSRPMPERDATHVQADTNGNVWMLRQQTHELKVFSDGKWFDATDALIQAGDSGGKLSALLPLGESKKILGINLVQFYRPDAAKTKATFILSVQDGQVKVEPLDELCNSQGAFLNVTYSPRGEPWLSVLRTDANNVTNVAYCRFTESGAAEFLEDHTIVGSDADGSLLVTTRRVPETLKLFHDGNFTELTALDAQRFRESKVACIAPGTFCYATEMGLHVASLKDPTNPIVYQLATDARPNTVEISPLGFAIVSVVPTNPTGNAPNLLFFPVKKP